MEHLSFVSWSPIIEKLHVLQIWRKFWITFKAAALHTAAEGPRHFSLCEIQSGKHDVTKKI